MGGLGLGPAKSSFSQPASATSDGRMTTQPVTPGTSRALSVNGDTPNFGVQASPTSSGVGSAALMPGTSGQTVDENGNLVDPSIGHINTGATQGELNNAGGTLQSGYLLHNFDANDLKAGIDPGYQFRMDQGNAALTAKRAAVGNRFGSQALKDIVNYNQDAGSQEFGNAYNRYNTNRDAIYNKLAAIAGTGQTQTNNNNAMGSTLGQTLGNNTQNGVSNSNNYLTSGAAASAAGQIGSTNAIVGGLNQAGNNWYQLQGRNGGSSNWGNNNYGGDGNGTSWNGNAVSSGGNTYYEG